MEAAEKLEIPESQEKRLHYENIFWIVVIHIAAIAAIPFFSWDAFAVCMVMLFTIPVIGVNLTYHRLLTHRAFKVPKWFEYILASVGAMTAEGPTMIWVAEHRLHHRFSDENGDPHNSRKGFWHAHMTHLFYHKDFEDKEEQWMKYVPDLASQKYYRFLNKYWLLYTLLPVPFLLYFGGISYLMWGGFVRIALTLHITWFVNSASHMWGYQSHKTNDNSKNCWWVGLLAAGEGWHNNHHAYPSCAAHGRRWWEFDLTYMIIRFFEIIGLATDVKKPIMEKV